MKKAARLFSISLIVIVVDQVVKLLVKFNMDKGEAGQIKVLGNFFKLHFIENNGAAFGLTLTEVFNNFGANMSEDTGKLILTIFSILAVVAIGVVLYRLRDHKSALPFFIALIFGGALGNIIDRTFYGIWFSEINDYTGGLFFGRVVDMFYLDIWKGYLPDWQYVPFFDGQYTALWPIFNIADSAIFVGILVILIFQNRFFKKDELARQGGEKVVTPKEEKPAPPTEEPVSAEVVDEVDASVSESSSEAADEADANLKEAAVAATQIMASETETEDEGMGEEEAEEG